MAYGLCGSSSLETLSDAAVNADASFRVSYPDEVPMNIGTNVGGGKMSYYVYILESEKNGKRYTGYTENLKERLRRHNSGGVKSTAPNKPYKLVYYEEFDSIDAAKGRELELKRKKSGGIYKFLNDSK